VTAGAQETKKLQELELLMDVERVIASTDAQRKSLVDMGIDVEKGLTGNGGLVGSISPVLLLSKPHWMQRISGVLTERMNAELSRGEAALREREGEGEADRANMLEEEGEDGQGSHRQRAQLMLLSVARTVAAGVLKHKVREKESHLPRHICVRLWDGWMRTASLRIELEASQWLHGRAMARAVLAQSPASLLLAMRRDAAEATLEAARGGGARRGPERNRSTNSGRRAGTFTFKPGESLFF